LTLLWKLTVLGDDPFKFVILFNQEIFIKLIPRK